MLFREDPKKIAFELDQFLVAASRYCNCLAFARCRIRFDVFLDLVIIYII